MTFTINYKSAIASILFLVIIGSIAVVPFSVHATAPVIDFTVIGKLIKEIAELTFQSGQLASLNAYFYVLKPAVKFLASLILQKLTQSIVSWIQSGGNTNFVANLKAALTDAADQAAGEFLNELAGTNLCAPFAHPLRSLFRVSITLNSLLSCTATDIFNNLNTSYQEFLDDFTKGGWIAYEITLSGSNNYFDALINTYDAKLRAESERVAITSAQYQAGNGFLGVNVQTPDCSDGFVDAQGNPICATTSTQTTPGTLVANLLAKSVGSGIDQAVNINDIGQALDAIIGALIGKLITSAQAGFFSNDTSSGLYDPGLVILPPPPPPPPPPVSVNIAGDIQLIDSNTAGMLSASNSITAILPQIDTALARIPPNSLTASNPNVISLRTVRTQLVDEQTTLQRELATLASWKTDLQNIQTQINFVNNNPNDAGGADLAGLYGRARQIDQDLTSETSDTITPAIGAVQSLTSQAQSLIAIVNQLQIQYSPSNPYSPYNP